MVIEIRSFSFLFDQAEELAVQGYTIIDCRSLPDPQGKGYGFSGKEKSIQEYVFRDPLAQQLLDYHVRQALDSEWGDVTKKFAFGCEGGKNRSVSLAERMYKDLTEALDMEANLEHLALPFWEQQSA